MAVFNNILAGASGQTGGAAAGYIIEKSLRFDKDASAYLNRTPSSDGNKRTWTYSTWLKLSDVVTATQNLINAGNNTTLGRAILRYSGQQFQFLASAVGGTTSATVYTDAIFRDPSAWYHLVFSVDTTQATATDRIKMWINGVAQTFATYTAPAQNGVFSINDNSLHKISGAVYTTGQYFNGYMADTILVDGQQLAETDFGEFDDNNVWQPIAYAGTYGTNGFHLDFSDATSTTTIAEDSSGNNNDWTANNISVTAGADNDSLFDSPTIANADSDTGAGGEVSGNYAILSPIWASSGATLSDGGLQLLSTSGQYIVASSTIPLLKKTYWETVVPAALTFFLPGIIRTDSQPLTSGSDRIGLTASAYPNSAAIWPDAQAVYYNGTSTYNTGNIWSPGDIIGHAFDPDTGNYYGWRNGSALNSGSAVATLSTSYTYAVALMTASTTNKAVINFGQRAFAYTAPTGYQPLTTALFDDPTIADGSTAMDVALYTGDGGDLDVTGLSFNPDLVWGKARSNSLDHFLQDSVRGVSNVLRSNTTGAEAADGCLASFNSDGFSVNPVSLSNQTSTTYVGWAWDGGSSTVSNTDGSITSSVRANASAGFSVVKFNQTSNNQTIGHGLGVEPAFIIGKYLDDVTNWRVYHKSLGTGSNLFLNLTNASSADNDRVTAVSSSTFTCGGAAFGTNGNTIAYCWAPVEGYSAFGSYTGNGSSDGPFVYTGFRPRWMLLRNADNTTGVDWILLDTARDTYNIADARLRANTSDQEGTESFIDITSNGFKVRTGGQLINGSGQTVIYAAFAEHPFKTARAR